ncbi:MAG: GHMP kinase, partial [Nitrospinaceae bacterium]
MNILSSAPTRIDLAGGTLDLWPLHLFFRNPPTLNAAIDLYATVQIRTRPGRSILVESKDRGLRARFPSLTALPEQHPLQLILRLIRFYRPRGGLEVVTHCQAPAGSGIGGSSALNIALNGALNRLTGNRYPRRTLVEIAKNIETQVIDAPAGVQDYYSALNGGVQSIRPDYDGIHPASLPVDPKVLNSRFVLCYTGEPRASGINNWQVYKEVIDGSPAVRRHLGRIAAVARQMEKKLAQGTLTGFTGDFDAEWRARRKLAPGICTPAMERLIAAARRAGVRTRRAPGRGTHRRSPLWIGRNAPPHGGAPAVTSPRG